MLESGFGVGRGRVKGWRMLLPGSEEWQWQWRPRDFLLAGRVVVAGFGT